METKGTRFEEKVQGEGEDGRDSWFLGTTHLRVRKKVHGATPSRIENANLRPKINYKQLREKPKQIGKNDLKAKKKTKKCLVNSEGRPTKLCQKQRK